MCELCENIACTDEEFGKMRMSGKDEFIFVDNNKYHIFTDTGDSGCHGILNDISHCPKCGRKLSEVSENE